MLAGLAAILSLAPSGLTVSTAKADITPAEPLPLGGYTERGSKLSEAGGERLFARCVSFRSGDTKIALVSAEMLTIPESLAHEVRERIPRNVQLFLAATHTHSAPDSQMLNDRMTFSVPGIAKFNPKWLYLYADWIAGSVNAALKSGSPVPALAVGVKHVDANQGRRKFAQPDNLLTAVWAGKPESTGTDRAARIYVKFAPPFFISYAAHGTVLDAKNMRTSGDWPGAFSKLTGAAVLQGAIGDVLPKTRHQASLEDVVEPLTSAMRSMQGFPVWTPGGRIETAIVPITLDPIRAHPTMARSYGVPDALAQSIVKQFAPTLANITAFRLGKLAVIGVPGEPTSILGRQIRDAGRRLGFESVLVCSHVNGWMGYILDPEDYDRGGYEATLSFYGREEGTKVVQAGIAALNRLARR